MRTVEEKMNKKKYYPSTIFSGEVILRGDSYDTYEEAKSNTNHVFPDVEWEEYNDKGMFVTASYSDY